MVDQTGTLDTGERKPFETLEGMKNDLQGDTGKVEKPKKKPGKGANQTGKKRGPYNKKPVAKHMSVDENENAPNINFDKEVGKTALHFIFQLLAERMGDHWKLTEMEAEQGAECLDQVFQKYFPDLGKWAVEINMALFLSFVIGPRMYVNAKLKAKFKELQKVKTDQSEPVPDVDNK